MLRIGNGFDIHNLFLSQNGLKRDFILAGINIDQSYQVDAHSDGDTLIHSVIDSILGALSLEDIGDLFPNTDIKYENTNSIMLLKQILDMTEYEIKWNLNNLDIVIILEKTKLKEKKYQIKEVLANIFGVQIKQIGVKAKTFEANTSCQNQVWVYTVLLIDIK